MDHHAAHLDPELVARIAATSGLPRGIARRLVEDVIAYHAESLDDYVVRRHQELVAEGVRNPDIFEQLRREVGSRVFKGPERTVRQIRRIIYG